MAGQGYRNVPRRQGPQDHGVGVAAAGLDGDGRGADDHAEGLVVVHRHRQLLGHSLVLAPGTRVGQGDGVVLGVGVLSGLHRHRLRIVPGGRAEGQGVRPAQTAQRKVRSVSWPVTVTVTVHRRLVGQLHRVGPAGVALVHRERGLAQRDGDRLVVVHRHRQLLGHSLVLAPGTRVGQGDGVVLGVGVLSGLHRHRLRIVPGGRVEGQGVRPAQTAQRKVGLVLAGHRHRDLHRRLVGQLHRVGLAVGVLLVHREVGLAQHDGDRLVVVHRHRQIG